MKGYKNVRTKRYEEIRLAYIANLLYALLLFLNQIDDLVELSGEKIETSKDSSVGSKRVRFHNFFVLDGVSDVYVAWVGDIQHGWVQIYIIGLLSFLTHVGYQPVDKRGLSRACHSQNNEHNGCVLTHRASFLALSGALKSQTCQLLLCLIDLHVLGGWRVTATAGSLLALHFDHFEV